jgi:hypothetical protein
MNSLEFKKIGNFWIDNGIVGLYKIIKRLQTSNEICIDFDLKLYPDRLAIELIEKDDKEDLHQNLLLILNTAKTEVVKTYLKATGAGWIYKQGNFEVYRKTDFKMHLKSFFTGKTPKTEGALYVPDAKDSDLGGKGRRMSEEEYTSFTQFKEANSPVIINDKKFPLTGKGFLNTPPQYEIGEDFRDDFLKKGKKQCLFSGQFYQIAYTVTGMDYPFLTGKSGELNFVSQLEGKPSISAQYSYIALFSFYNLYYQLQNDLKNYFILYDSNLKELSNFYNAIQPDITQLKNTDYCNFETHITGTQYESESLFNFLISVYKQVQPKMDKDKRRELFSKSVFTLSNDGNIFRDVKEYTSLVKLFDVFDAFRNQQEVNYFNDFLTLVRFFNKKIKSTEYDTIWRNRLCSNILSFRSVHKIIEWFLSDVKMKEETGNIYQLDKILEIYNQKTQPNMKTEMVDLCKRMGNSIGRYCRENENKGILFSMRNAKNRSEFLNVLAETQFRTEVLYSEEFFKQLPDGREWEEYKSLVSIFAMNSFLFKKESKTAVEQ